MENRETFLGPLFRDHGTLAAQKDDGGGGGQTENVVVVDKVDRRVVDSDQRLLDHNGVQRSGDGGQDAKENSELLDVDFGGDSGVESAKYGETGSQDKARGGLTEQSVGKHDCEGKDKTASNLYGHWRLEIDRMVRTHFSLSEY